MFAPVLTMASTIRDWIMFEASLRPQFAAQKLKAVVERHLSVLNGQHTSINLNRAATWNRVHANPATNCSDTQRRVPAKRMIRELGRHVPRVLIQSVQYSRHSINCVVTQMRLRAVRGRAQRAGTPPRRAFVRDNYIQLSRLGHNRRIRHTR